MNLSLLVTLATIVVSMLNMSTELKIFPENQPGVYLRLCDISTAHTLGQNRHLFICVFLKGLHWPHGPREVSA